MASASMAFVIRPFSIHPSKVMDVHDEVDDAFERFLELAALDPRMP
jgi:hypothetical protein